MKHKIFLSMLSLCVLCSDAAFGSRAKKGPSTQSKKVPTTQTAPVTAPQTMKARDRISLLDLPNLRGDPKLNFILDLLLDSDDPLAVPAIERFNSLFLEAERAGQTETLNATLTDRNRVLLREASESKARLEDLRKRVAEFRSEVKTKSDEAKQKNDELQLKNAQLKTLVGQSETKLEQVKKAYAEKLENLKKQHEQQLSASQTELARLQRIVGQGSQETIDQLTQRNAELSAQIEELIQKNGETLRQIEADGQRREAELQREIERLSASQRALQANAEEYKQKIKSHDAITAKLLAQVKQTEDLAKSHSELLGEVARVLDKSRGAGMFPGLFPGRQVLMLDLPTLAKKVPDTALKSSTLPGVIDGSGRCVNFSLVAKKIDVGTREPSPLTAKELDFMKFFFQNCNKQEKYSLIHSHFISIGMPSDRLLIQEGVDGLSLYIVQRNDMDQTIVRLVSYDEGTFILRSAELLSQPEAKPLPIAVPQTPEEKQLVDTLTSAGGEDDFNERLAAFYEFKQAHPDSNLAIVHGPYGSIGLIRRQNDAHVPSTSTDAPNLESQESPEANPGSPQQASEMEEVD